MITRSSWSSGFSWVAEDLLVYRMKPVLKVSWCLALFPRLQTALERFDAPLDQLPSHARANR